MFDNNGIAEVSRQFRDIVYSGESSPKLSRVLEIFRTRSPPTLGYVCSANKDFPKSRNKDCTSLCLNSIIPFVTQPEK